jgi:hypothetical protein
MASSNVNLGSKISDFITKSSGPTSKGLCSLFVREAIQKALNIKVEPTGINSAKDYGPWLIRNGFKRSDKLYTKANVGDVAVIQSVSGHNHGHIQIYSSDGKWRSDFVQKGFFPYLGENGSYPAYTMYEIK